MSLTMCVIISIESYDNYIVDYSKARVTLPWYMESLSKNPSLADRGMTFTSFAKTKSLTSSIPKCRNRNSITMTVN